MRIPNYNTKVLANLTEAFQTKFDCIDDSTEYNDEEELDRSVTYEGWITANTGNFAVRLIFNYTYDEELEESDWNNVYVFLPENKEDEYTICELTSEKVSTDSDICISAIKDTQSRLKKLDFHLGKSREILEDFGWNYTADHFYLSNILED